MILAFGSVEIDPALRQVRRDGREIVVQPLIFDLLLHFARHPNVLVSKEALIRDVWKGVVVGDGAIAQAMSLVRRTLRVEGENASAIHTVWGRGYRFAANVRVLGNGDSPGAPQGGGTPPLGRLPFVGRAQVMALLERALEEARRGEARVVLLSGEPGSGKTRVCVELAEVARAERCRVLVAQAPEPSGAPSYWLWVDLVRQALATATPALRADPRTAALRDAILPERRRLDEALPEPMPSEAERSRFELFEHVAWFWKSLATDGPLVLILDDVHRGDVESLELLDFVVNRTAQSRIVFVVTFRPPEIRTDEARGHAIGLLARRANAVSERLERLSLGEVAEIVGLLTGEARDEALAATLFERSGGNPFLLKEMIWLRQRGPASAPGSDDQVGFPAALWPAVERHLDVVSTKCRELLAVAAVVGRDFDLPVLAATSGWTIADVTTQVDEAVRAEVVTAVPGGHLRFAHALVRDAIYDALPRERRIALHARAGRAIEATYGARDAHVEALAHHFHEAMVGGEARRALTYTVRAARVAMRAAAFRQAVAHYRRAMEIAPLAEAGEDTVLALQVGIAEAAANVGDFETVRAEARGAMDRARRLGDTLAFARAAHCFSLRSEADVAHAEVIQAIEEALERYTEETPLRVRLLTRLASARWFASPPATSRELAKRAVEAGRLIDDPDALSVALTRAYRIFQGPAEYHALRGALAEETLALLPRVRGPGARLDCRWHLVGDAVERGDRVAFDQRVDAMLREAVESPHPFADWYAASCRVARLQLEARFDAAEAEARRGLTMAAPGGSEFRAHVFDLQMAGIRLAEGRFDEHVDEFRRAVTADRPALWAITLALGDAMCGRRRAADDTLSAYVADGLRAIPRDSNWANTVVALTELCLALGRADAAPTLLSQLMPLEERHVAIGPAWLHYGAIARRIGLLAGLLGRHEDAERFIREGLERDARMGAPALVALGRMDLARLLLRRGRRAPRGEAISLLETVVADASHFGLRRLRGDAELLLRR